jgi:hypothetical protein
MVRGRVPDYREHEKPAQLSLRELDASPDPGESGNGSGAVLAM